MAAETRVVDPEELRDFALVIGIDTYTRLNRPLAGAGNDATEFIAWLGTENSDGFFDETRIYSKTALVRFSDLHEAISDLIEIVGDGRGRRLYVFIAGHGAGTNLGSVCLYCSEHSSRNEAAWEILQDVTILSCLFYEVIVFVDCCRTADVGANPRRMTMHVPATREPDIRFYCLGCQHGSTTVEREFNGRTRGVFSNTLLRALRGEVPDAVDSSGQVTAYSLTRYLKSARVKPDINPDDAPDEYLQRIVLARGFSPTLSRIEITLHNQFQEFSVFDVEGRPLQPKRTYTANGTVLVDREHPNASVIVAVPYVTDLRNAAHKDLLLPFENVLDLTEAEWLRETR